MSDWRYVADLFRKNEPARLPCRFFIVLWLHRGIFFHSYALKTQRLLSTFIGGFYQEKVLVEKVTIGNNNT